MTTVTATEAELAAAFTEWDRRYREEPERFMSEAARLLRETPDSYGAACAPYLLAILGELRPATDWDNPVSWGDGSRFGDLPLNEKGQRTSWSHEGSRIPGPQSPTDDESGSRQ